MRSCSVILLAAALAAGFPGRIAAGEGAAGAGEPLPAGYWPAERCRPILDATVRIRLAPDLSGLSPGEREALDALLEVGTILQRIYEDARHPEALDAQAALVSLHAARGRGADTQTLLDLYRLFQGPIATTLDNAREAFLPVAPETAGKNVYPPGATPALIATAPGETERRAWLDGRTVVRAATAEDLRHDLEMIERHPILASLHPEVRARLDAARDTPRLPYAVPYAVAWGDELVRCRALLNRAAEACREEDPDFSSYLRLRALDLVTNDYEAGDASWVSGSFRHLNAQIGPYETYDDELLGVKTFFGMSLLLRDDERTARLSAALGDLRDIENALPYEAHRKVRTAIPVGVYDVIADFGQARGTNTATILPNDPDHARKYGRTILMRENILRHPDLVAISRAMFAASVVEDQVGDLTADGEFERTLWHEIGHYMGPARTHDGRALDQALSPWADLIEEMKADLVALFSATALHRSGYLDDTGLRGMQASGVRRVIQNVRPRRSQPYQTMRLMQMNDFLEHGLLRQEGARLRIDYTRYQEVVARLLGEVLAIQEEGSASKAEAFVERLARWEAAPHEAIAARLREAARWRYRLVTYAALGE